MKSRIQSEITHILETRGGDARTGGERGGFSIELLSFDPMKPKQAARCADS